MSVERSHVLSLVAVVAFWSVLTSCGMADETPGFGTLRHASSISRDSLQMVTGVEVSSDGKFLYAAAWRAAAITVFQRDLETGELSHLQELIDPDTLGGVTAVRLSPDGRYLASSAFRSKCVELYRRDPQTGRLTKLDDARNNRDGVTGLQFPIDVAFSPDSKTLYVIDAHGPTRLFAARTGSVTAFGVSEEGQLKFIEANLGKDNCFNDARGIAAHADAKAIVVTASTAGTLVVLDRDVATGKTTIRQVIRNGDGEVRGLDGVVGVAFSPDGQFVYTSAGRFRGESVVGVYKFDDAGKLSLVQELDNAGDDLEGFLGGNEITVTADGRSVYAVASRSESVSCFDRDTKTGRLTFIETIANEAGRTTAAAGIAFSPDGRFIYVAAESSNTISCFHRAIDTSALPTRSKRPTPAPARIAIQDVAFVGVSVIPMVREEVLADMTVVVVDGRIREMGSTAKVAIPEGILVVDGKGKFLMPGLVDMHVHPGTAQELTLFVANGVTTVRNMFGSPMHLNWRNEIAQGTRFGPTIYTAGPIVDGPPARWPNSREVATPEDARKAVQEHVERGYDFIKVYDGLSADVYAALVKAAKQSSLQVMGHVPNDVGVDGVLEAGQRTIEHLDGYETFLESSDSPVLGRTDMGSRMRAWGHMDRDLIPLIVEKIKQAGAWNCVTLVVMQRGYSLSPEEIKKELELPYMKYLPSGQVQQWKGITQSIPSGFAEAIRSGQPARSELVGAFHKAGAPILLGTDVGNPWVAAGFSAHQELANLIDAGLTPYEALRAGTRNPAECLDATDEFGSVAVGLRADLLLLDANPLEDVANAARRVGVMRRGQWLTAAELHEMLEKFSSENKESTENKEQKPRNESTHDASHR
jgi:imidazolonepropionase-like amidohydrolase/6-phosphogluconolactonase (cycloisomerase 2 family)